MEFSNVTTNTQQNRVANKLPSGNLSAIFNRYTIKIKKDIKWQFSELVQNGIKMN